MMVDQSPITAGLLFPAVERFGCGNLGNLSIAQLCLLFSDSAK